MDRRHVRELGRDLYQGLCDQNGDRVEVRGIDGEPQPLGLERDRAAAAERIKDGRRVTAGRSTDLSSGLLEDRLVGAVLPLHEALDDPEEATALGLLASSVGKRTGSEDGSSTRLAKSTARQAASGRRAHHR